MDDLIQNCWQCLFGSGLIDEIATLMVNNISIVFPRASCPEISLHVVRVVQSLTWQSARHDV